MSRRLYSRSNCVGVQVLGLLGEIGELIVELERGAHVAHGGAGIGAVGVIQLDLVVDDVGLQARDRPRERIAVAPEPDGVERLVQHVGEGVDVGSPGTVEGAEEEEVVVVELLFGCSGTRCGNSSRLTTTQCTNGRNESSLAVFWVRLRWSKNVSSALTMRVPARDIGVITLKVTALPKPILRCARNSTSAQTQPEIPSGRGERPKYLYTQRLADQR